MPPFSIAASGSSKAELQTRIDERAQDNPNVPDAAVQAFSALLDEMPEVEPGQEPFVAQIAGLTENIPADPQKPGSGTRAFMRIEING